MTFSAAPFSFKAYRQRILTGRSACVLLALVLLAGTEMHFSWLESAVGAYLISTNDLRPESGAIWEQGHQSESARNALNQHMDRRQGVQREVRLASSMGQVLAGIEAGRGAMISAAHFLELYRKLPPVLSKEIASPYLLLAQWSGEKWQRTFFEFQNAGLAIYLLDAHSQVLLRLDLGPDLVEHIRRGEVAIQASLDQLSDFSAHIYSAGHFFSVLNTLPANIRKNAVAQPEDLLRISEKIKRVGISSESLAGAVDLGFEVEDANGVRVILTQGATTAVLRLREALDRRAFSGPGIAGEPHP